MFWVTALIVLLIDQATKFLVRAYLPEGVPIKLVTFLYLTYVRNYGVAFGLMSKTWPLLFFVVATLVVVAVIITAYRRLATGRRLVVRGLALLLGGATGNLIDRVHQGFVTDFLDMRIWPVFNVADIAIVVGVALICWELLLGSPSSGEGGGRPG